MKHTTKNNSFINSMQFVPFEDFLGLGLDSGFSSILIPGSGDPNFDSYENNPYATKRQDQERLVQQLLDKLPHQTIAIDPNYIGTVDRASKEVIEAEIQ